MEAFFILLGLLVGAVVSAGLFFATVPFHAANGIFVNKPTKEGPSGIHFFTQLEPGQVKIIERGGKFVRMISNTADLSFAREGDDVTSPNYWKLKPGKTENPVADVWSPIQWWAQLVYDKTGLVFTGIYPFQKVREYPLERTKFVQTENDNERHHPNSNLKLEVVNDWSDHHRIQKFLMDVHIAGAEVQGNIPLDILAVVELVTTDPFKAAYEIDRWDRAMFTLVTDAVNSVARQLKLEQVVTSEKGDSAERIAKTVVETKEDTEHFGIDITGFRIREINIIVGKAELADLQAAPIAAERAKATRIDGEARAAVLREINKANAEGGEHAVESLQSEALVRAAEAAGKNGGTVILMPGRSRNDADSTNLAILAELKRLGGQRRQDNNPNRRSQ